MKEKFLYSMALMGIGTVCYLLSRRYDYYLSEQREAKARREHEEYMRRSRAEMRKAETEDKKAQTVE